MSDTCRIALWSGPRNVSTAMMRAWENRPDTWVVDEPFYAYYLKTTGIDHPLADEIVARGETRWERVAQWLEDVEEVGYKIFFQKQMTLHLLPGVGRDWMLAMRNGFLIRHPRDVITSYYAKRRDISSDDLGYERQAELYGWVERETGSSPPVVDARDVRDHPASVLSELCARLGVEFDDAMLSWLPGRRPSDGLWAPHWYGAVESSTGWEPYRAKNEEVPAHLETLYGRCLAAYEVLYEKRIRP